MTSTSQDETRPQDELLEFLQSVRPDSTSPTATNSSSAPACPLCGSRSSGAIQTICPDCHFSPQLGRKVTRAEIFKAQSGRKPTAPPVASPSGQTSRRALLVGTSVSCGTLILAVGLCRLHFPLESRERGWGRMLFLAGLLTFGVAHARAYLIRSRWHYLQTANASSMASLFQPVEIWGPLIQSGRVPPLVVYAGTWGLTAMALSLAVLGVGVEDLATR